MEGEKRNIKKMLDRRNKKRKGKRRSKGKKKRKRMSRGKRKGKRRNSKRKFTLGPNFLSICHRESLRLNARCKKCIFPFCPVILYTKYSIDISHRCTYSMYQRQP
jgi:hypothetical protein